MIYNDANELLAVIFQGKRATPPIAQLSKEQIMLAAINHAMYHVEKPVLEITPNYMRKPVAIFAQHGISPDDVQAWYDAAYGEHNQNKPQLKALRSWIYLYRDGDFVLADSEPQLYNEDGTVYTKVETSDDYYGTAPTTEERFRKVNQKRMKK